MLFGDSKAWHGWSFCWVVFVPFILIAKLSFLETCLLPMFFKNICIKYLFIWLGWVLVVACGI